MKHRRTRKAPHRKRRSVRFRAREKAGTCVIENGVITWKLPRKLRSLNVLKTGLARYGDTKAWESQFVRAELLRTDESLGPSRNVRLRLDITRLTPSDKWYLDKVNLYGGCKGLEDSLVRLGFLVDDNAIWEDGPYAEQALSPDGKFWTIVSLSEIPMK